MYVLILYNLKAPIPIFALQFDSLLSTQKIQEWHVPENTTENLTVVTDNRQYLGKTFILNLRHGVITRLSAAGGAVLTAKKILTEQMCDLISNQPLFCVGEKIGTQGLIKRIQKETHEDTTDDTYTIEIREANIVQAFNLRSAANEFSKTSGTGVQVDTALFSSFIASDKNGFSTFIFEKLS